MTYFFRRLAPYALLFLGLETLLRITLTLRSTHDMGLGLADTANIFARGLWMDIATAPFILLVPALVILAVPARLWATRAGHWAEHALRFVFLYSLIFDFVAEHIFWTEFTTRFNFIAVDYLVYTNEVIGNIVESYPLGWLLAAIGIVSGLITWAMRRIQPQPETPVQSRFSMRLAAMAAFAALGFGFYSAADIDQARYSTNTETGELAANGIYNLFHAFWHNEINYSQFYAQRDPETVRQDIATLRDEQENTRDRKDDLSRIIRHNGAEKHKNVIIVVMESMSADFMGAFGNQNGLTPNLDRLANEGLFFANNYATGTRTVRGLEAVTLSIPPTPGQSIVRRPGNENLYSLGFVFKDRGYDTTFLYGGYGYFDNMNAFFAGNGFDIVDRTKFDKSEYSFANVWGIADDDVFAKALRLGDASYAAHRPFMQLIMTTSNHRPYTFAEGRIDIPSGSGREAGVKYADYSVGRLMEWAKKKPWFNDTVFVFVADHTAGAGGKVELAANKYHIPMIFYAPKLIKKQRFDSLSSQLDLAPTLLGRLNFSYRSKFYGEDLLNDRDEISHTFISNYQKVALVKNDIITILAPKKVISQYTWPAQNQIAKPDGQLANDTIAYYQSASWWRDTFKRVSSLLD